LLAGAAVFVSFTGICSLTAADFCCSGAADAVAFTVVFDACAGDLNFTPRIKDRLCCKERNAKVKQVKKNEIANIVVSLVRNALVLVPKTESKPEKLSTRPPPLPLCIKIIPIKPTQMIICITTTKPIIFSPYMLVLRFPQMSQV
jgi:hypothetical protein